MVFVPCGGFGCCDEVGFGFVLGHAIFGAVSDEIDAINEGWADLVEHWQDGEEGQSPGRPEMETMPTL